MPFFGAEYTVDVEVLEVEAFQSYAQYKSGPSNLVAELWLAKPLKSAYVLQVAVHPSNEDNTVIDDVNEKWKEYNNDTVPLNFQAAEPRDFQIRITRCPKGDGDHNLSHYELPSIGSKESNIGRNAVKSDKPGS